MGKKSGACSQLISGEASRRPLMLGFKMNLKLKTPLTMKPTTEASEAVFINQWAATYSSHFNMQSVLPNHVIDAQMHLINTFYKTVDFS